MLDAQIPDDKPLPHESPRLHGRTSGGPLGKGQLDVNWDSGSTLSMLLNDGDRVGLITPAPGAGTGEAGKEPGR